MQCIIGKYNFDVIDAIRSFIGSETHALLEDADNGLWAFPAYAVFDMWEAEQITVDPRNAACIRGE